MVGFKNMPQPELKIVAEHFEKLGLHAPISSDPVNAEYYVAQVTHPQATKGGALSVN